MRGRVSPVARFANLALLVLFPIAWFAPLLRAGLLPFFGTKDISVMSGLVSLWDSDRALALIVAFFALVAPLVKTLGMAALHAGWLTPRALPALSVMAKLAMADIFLIALYVVVAKGVGVGRVETAWGLWLFTGCVVVSLILSVHAGWTRRR